MKLSSYLAAFVLLCELTKISLLFFILCCQINAGMFLLLYRHWKKEANKQQQQQKKNTKQNKWNKQTKKKHNHQVLTNKYLSNVFH